MGREKRKKSDCEEREKESRRLFFFLFLFFFATGNRLFIFDLVFFPNSFSPRERERVEEEEEKGSLFSSLLLFLFSFFFRHGGVFVSGARGREWNGSEGGSSDGSDVDKDRRRWSRRSTSSPPSTRIHFLSSCASSLFSPPPGPASPGPRLPGDSALRRPRRRQGPERGLGRARVGRRRCIVVVVGRRREEGQARRRGRRRPVFLHEEEEK